MAAKKSSTGVLLPPNETACEKSQAISVSSLAIFNCRLIHAEVPFCSGFTPQRVDFSNTLAMAHNSDAAKLIRIKHTRDVHQNLANTREVIHVANAGFHATAEQYRLLAQDSINQADLRSYVKRVLKVQNDQDAGSRTKNIIERIIGLAEAGRGERPGFCAGDSLDSVHRRQRE